MKISRLITRRGGGGLIQDITDMPLRNFLILISTLNESKCAREVKYITNYYYIKRLSIA